ncbi:heterogeneous nuclear ribonucleoprotein Q-like isoform X2 [Aristolochia californica]|uniref:heterogeneous nuclear ribonucleoprotein Q-like isoform X2 n=1 Tax=Aristolochia californica TaxID=171875 RepID=UPI0035D88252
MQHLSLQMKPPGIHSSDKASADISYLQKPPKADNEMKTENHRRQSRRILIDLNMASIDDTWAFPETLDADASPGDAERNALAETMVGRPENELLTYEAETVEGEEADDAEQVEEEEVEEEEYMDEVEEGRQEKVEEVRQASEPVKERRKRKDFEIFVGGLDREAVEEDLEKVFMKVGEVVEVRLVRQQNSNRNKGFAFVRFATVEQARRAAKELKFTQVKGKVCGVTRSNDKETLHLRNICPTWTKDMLVEKLKAYDLDNLDEVHLMKDPIDKGKNRGYAFVDFSTHMDAVAACSKLQKGSFYFGTKVRAEVAFAKTMEPDEEVMSQVKSVFLDGLPANWDEAHVHEQFRKFGEIENVELACNMPTAKRKDFGFITFQTRDSALTCIDDVNKVGVGEGAEKVSMKATLRKPLPRRDSHQPVGGWRGRLVARHGGMGTRPWGLRYRYPERPNRTCGIMGRSYGGGYSGYDTYQTRGNEFETASPPIHRYQTRLRRDIVQHISAPSVTRRKSRDLYMESSSAGTYNLAYEQDDHPTSNCRFPSRRAYADDRYDSRYAHNETNRSESHNYASVSGLKRPYSSLDADLSPSSTLSRQSGRDSSSEIEAYPHRGVFSYDHYSSSRDDRYAYDKADYTGHSFRSRYLSGNEDSRSSYY